MMFVGFANGQVEASTARDKLWEWRVENITTLWRL
jgi:hypothetical protein